METRVQIAEESEIDVELLVAGAIEGAHRCLPHAAGRTHLPLVEHERRRPVLDSRLPEDGAPDVLSAAKDLRYELPHLVRRRAPGRFARVLAAHALRGSLLCHLCNDSGIDAEDKVRD